MVSFGLSVSLLAGSVLVQLDPRALRDGEALEHAARVRRAFCELRLQQNHVAASLDSSRILLWSDFARVCDGFAASRVSIGWWLEV